MKKIVTCTQMKYLDAYTIHNIGIPSMVLMERASLSVVDELEKVFSDTHKEERILVVCGSGNNGGDGIAIARILHLHGYHAAIYFVGNREKMTEETAMQWKIAENYSVPIVNNPNMDEYTTIVDAIFGVELTRNIEGNYRQVIQQMNQANAWKVAVDIASGIHGDTGHILGYAFKADLTVTFAFRKIGHCFYPGRLYSGKVIVKDIGIYDSSIQNVNVKHFERKDLKMIPDRVAYGHKGTFGKVLIVAGSEGMCGAAYLAASAAFATGAGMVKIQTVEANRIPLQTLLPEAMLSCIFEENENRNNLNWCDILVIGPGIGTSSLSEARVEWFLKHAAEQCKPVILDADGLNLLSVHPEWKKFLSGKVILTPHIMEMSRLLSIQPIAIHGNMIEFAARLSKETDAVCVLKDAVTVITDSGENTYLNLNGNAGMATAGSGDALTGVIAGICCMDHLAIGYSMAEKAAFGVFLHGAAGDHAAELIGKDGMRASDIIQSVSAILKNRFE